MFLFFLFALFSFFVCLSISLSPSPLHMWLQGSTHHRWRRKESGSKPCSTNLSDQSIKVHVPSSMCCHLLTHSQSLAWPVCRRPELFSLMRSLPPLPLSPILRPESEDGSNTPLPDQCVLVHPHLTFCYQLHTQSGSSWKLISTFCDDGSELAQPVKHNYFHSFEMCHMWRCACMCVCVHE